MNRLLQEAFQAFFSTLVLLCRLIRKLIAHPARKQIMNGAGSSMKTFRRPAQLANPMPATIPRGISSNDRKMSLVMPLIIIIFVYRCVIRYSPYYPTICVAGLRRPCQCTHDSKRHSRGSVSETVVVHSTAPGPLSSLRLKFTYAFHPILKEASNV